MFVYQVDLLTDSGCVAAWLRLEKNMTSTGKKLQFIFLGII